MRSLTSLVSLPKMGVGSIDDSLVSFATVKPTTLINETYTNVNTTFGSTGPFGKVTSAAPSFADLGAGAVLGTPTIADSPYSLVVDGEGKKTRFGTSNFTAGQVREAVGDTQTDDESHFVRLKSKAGDGATSSLLSMQPGMEIEPLSESEVVFYVMPQISESYDANYEALSPSQMPGEFMKYKGSSSTKYNISNAKFTSRTREEAKRNYLILNTLRGWTKPYFGAKQAMQFDNKLGAPPPVLELSGWRNLMGPVSVVITRLQWTWPDDVDWLPTGIFDTESNKEIPFPAVITVALDLTESLSAEQFNNFDLVAYRRGFNKEAWNTPMPNTSSTRGGEPVGGQQMVSNGVVQPDGSDPTGVNERAQTSVDTASIKEPVSTGDGSTQQPNQLPTTDTPTPAEPAASAATKTNFDEQQRELLLKSQALQRERTENESTVSNADTTISNTTANIQTQEQVLASAQAADPPDTAAIDAAQRAIEFQKRRRQTAESAKASAQIRIEQLSGEMQANSDKLSRLNNGG